MHANCIVFHFQQNTLNVTFRSKQRYVIADRPADKRRTVKLIFSKVNKYKKPFVLKILLFYFLQIIIKKLAELNANIFGVQMTAEIFQMGSSDGRTFKNFRMVF